MNRSTRLITTTAAAGLLALGLTACGSVGQTPDDDSPSQIAANGDAPPPVPDAFDGKWSDDASVWTLQCDAAAACRLAIAGSPGALTGNAALKAEHTYTLDLKQEDGTRGKTLTLTFQADGKSMKAAEAGGEEHVLVRRL